MSKWNESRDSKWQAENPKTDETIVSVIVNKGIFGKVYWKQHFGYEPEKISKSEFERLVDLGIFVKTHPWS